MKILFTRFVISGLIAIGVSAGTVQMSSAGIANPGNVAAELQQPTSSAEIVKVRDRYYGRRHGGRHFRHVRPHHRFVHPHHRYVRPYRNYGRYYGPRSGIYLGFGAPYYGSTYYRPPVYYAPRYAGPRYRRLTRAHIRWCYRHYRSYRASDNTFQPYNGPRRQCRAPY